MFGEICKFLFRLLVKKDNKEKATKPRLTKI